MKRTHEAKQNSGAYVPPEIRFLIDNPTGTIVVGMSGIGKSRLTSRIATEGQWRRISIDAEIQSRYLREEINTTFLSEIADRPMLSRMHAAGALAIDWELCADTLEPLSAWLGMPGDKSRGGLAFEEYMRRQKAHYTAERRALEDLLLLESDPDQPLLVDTSGSFCEVLSIDDELFERLAERFKFVSLRETDARMSSYFALHINAFSNALFAGAGRLRAVCDEFSNMPLKALVEQLTTLRAYGGEFHMIVQSCSELIRKYGREETETIEENAIVKIWLGFSSFREADRISKAMGEEHAVASSLGLDSESLKASTNLSLIKQRVMTPAELMAMPRGTMLVQVKGVGFFTLKMLFQNNFAPFCDQLARNPLEGGRLPSDPQVILKVPAMPQTEDTL